MAEEHCGLPIPLKLNLLTAHEEQLSVCRIAHCYVKRADHGRNGNSQGKAP